MKLPAAVGSPAGASIVVVALRVSAIGRLCAGRVVEPRPRGAVLRRRRGDAGRDGRVSNVSAPFASSRRMTIGLIAGR